VINGVWIIQKGVGICIFHHEYSGKQVDPQLFSGLISGIYTFSEGILETGRIEIVELTDMKLLYGVDANLIFILSITKDEDMERSRQRLAEISQEFIYQFKDYLQNWDGDPGVFEPFWVELNHILERRGRVEVVEIPVRLPEKKRLRLTTEELGVLLWCDGKRASIKIANEIRMPQFQLMLILKELEKRKIIQLKRLMEFVET
jgi:hypothetical protein